MPIFTYTAKDYQGAYHKGEVETADAHEASRLLQRKKLIVISITQVYGDRQHFWDRYLNKVSFTDVVVMTRQLSTMISAGLILSEAIDILVDQQANKQFKKELQEVSNDVKGGLDFASALEKHKDIFPDLYINLIRAGEASGKLDIILLQLADNLDKQREFQSKVRGAMIYPIVIMVLMTVVMSVMIFFVIPKLTSLYTQSNLELPLPTKILLAFTGFVTSYWWIVLLLIIGFVYLFRKWYKTAKGRLTFDTYILKTPILGRIINLVVLTNFTRTFALLAGAGIPILDIIKVVSNVVGNAAYKEALDTSYRGVERGLTLSNQILGSNLFPKIVGQMIRTGEETGKLDEVLLKLSMYFESEADTSLKNITTLIEPIILVVLGVGVGFLVLSVILPIYKLTTSIQ